MKYLIYTLAITALLFAACEDPIDVTTDPAEDLVTVDAWLDNIPDTKKAIKLSYSQPYFDSSFVAGINEAAIAIISSTGKTHTFESVDDNGNYELASPLDEWLDEPVGTEYTIEIDLAGNLITGTAVKNRVPEIDSIYQELREGEAFVDDGIYCNFFATDLEGRGDSYWIKTYKNGEYLNKPGELNIAFDAAFSSGSEVDNLVFIQPIQELNNPIDENFAPIPWVEGDIIRVEIHSITNEAFFYMEVLRDQLLNSNNSIFAEPLANTRGNLQSADGKTVLGYFNVASTSVLEETIGE